tara:strand:+ start:201 stop:359 length:159 start_codon:yes stop_codon:yes gene_type:complete
VAYEDLLAISQQRFACPNTGAANKDGGAFKFNTQNSIERLIGAQLKNLTNLP